MQYYVYALIDPRTNTPFYIGKGKDNRVRQHFLEANEKLDDYDIDKIFDDELLRINTDSNKGKLLKIKELHSNGYDFSDIARIIAKNLDETSALAIEAFLIKSIYGFDNLTNLVMGHHHERFRPYSNWNLIDGYDTQELKKGKSSRQFKLDAMIAEGLDKPLEKVSRLIPEINFDNPKVLDAGEIGIEGDVAGARLKIALRRSNIYCELRPRKKVHREWLDNHFERLDCKNLLRKDGVFLPPCWKGKINQTNDIHEVVRRAKLLIEICNATNYESLSEVAKDILKSSQIKNPQL